MRINVTFVIQIVNFGVSYLILHKIFLKPFVRLIETKQSAKTALCDRIKSRELELIQLQESKKTHLHQFRIYLKTRYSVSPLPLHDIPPSATCVKNQQELDLLAEDGIKLVITKAPHAY